MDNRKICEICYKSCPLNHKKTHYINYNEFTFKEMNHIFSFAKHLNLKDKNLILEKIRKVLNDEYNDFKNNLSLKYNLIMVDFYTKKYYTKINDEFFLVQNYYTYFSKFKENQFKHYSFDNNITFETFVKEVRKDKINKRHLCLHCCKYYQNIKNHNFFIIRKKKIHGCRELTNKLINSKKEDIIHFLTDVIKYDERAFENTSISEIKNQLVEYIKCGKIKISLKNEDEALDLYDNIKKYFFSDGRVGNHFAKLNWIKKHQIQNNNNKNNKINDGDNTIIELEEEETVQKTKKRNKKRNLNLLDVMNNEFYVEASNNFFLNKRKRNPTNNKNNNLKSNNNTSFITNSDLSSTELSILNSSNFPDKLETQITNIFNKYIFK